MPLSQFRITHKFAAKALRTGKVFRTFARNPVRGAKAQIPGTHNVPQMGREQIALFGAHDHAHPKRSQCPQDAPDVWQLRAGHQNPSWANLATLAGISGAGQTRTSRTIVNQTA